MACIPSCHLHDPVLAASRCSCVSALCAGLDARNWPAHHWGRAARLHASTSVQPFWEGFTKIFAFDIGGVPTVRTNTVFCVCCVGALPALPRRAHIASLGAIDTRWFPAGDSCVSACERDSAIASHQAGEQPLDAAASRCDGPRHELHMPHITWLTPTRGTTWCTPTRSSTRFLAELRLFVG
jgi:hypothetical protein